MSGYFNDYEKLYPDIIIEILEYFNIANTNPDDINDKTILKFAINIMMEMDPSMSLR